MFDQSFFENEEVHTQIIRERREDTYLCLT
jgi:hypothetical protein